jgi:SAM-dependent methyltransferase
MEDVLYTEMAAMEERHFWFAARRRILLSVLVKHLGAEKALRLCDLGCGCGINMRFFGRYYTVEGMDASPHALRFCRERGLAVKSGALPHDMPFEPGAFDACLLLDVLEHLDEDKAAVPAAARVLKPGGILLATVPAFPCLYIGRDAFHGHKRRYHKKAFRALFADDRFRIRKFSYFNTVLFPPIAASRRLLKRFGTDKKAPDLFIPPGPINAALEGLFALERLPLALINLPFGLSLMCVAEKRSG